jgi:hypothetical protein
MRRMRKRVGDVLLVVFCVSALAVAAYAAYLAFIW